MRTLCLFISHLPAQVEARDPATPPGAPAGVPLVIGGLPHERKAVYDASPSAIERGVKPGMALRHAYSLCPEARFLPADKERYALAFEEVLQVMDDFSPVVEGHEIGTAFLDASGLDRYYNGEDRLASQLLDRVRTGQQLIASIGMADSRFAARVAANLTGPGESTLVPCGNERDFLAPLPIDTLPCPEDIKRQLRLLGINSVGELADLGPRHMAARFATEGLLAYQLACGIDESPLVPRQKPARIERTVSFDPPVDTLDRLLEGMGEAMDVLSDRLKERWQLCRRMELHLRFDSGVSREEALAVKTPTCSKKTLLSLVRLRLERAKFDSAVAEATISLSGLCKDGRQLSLHGEDARRKRRIAPAAREIRGRWGRNMIKRPVLLHEEAFLPEQRFDLRDIEL